MIKFLLKYKKNFIYFTIAFISLITGFVIAKVELDNKIINLVANSTPGPTVVAVKKEEKNIKKTENIKLKEAKDDVRATNEPVDVKTGKIKRPKENAQTCVLSVKCTDVLQNPQMLNPKKASIIPQSGVIYHTEYAEFREGETVFEVFKREMKTQKLHFDYDENTTGGAFVSGIGNLYNGDCGANSGWMYYVNGEIPQVGCSQYVLQGGDIIEWIYICDLNTLF